MIIGWINVVVFVVIAAFMVLSCVRKHRMTKFVWFCLFCLEFCIFIVSVGQLVFKDITTKNCNFALGIIYSVEVGLLFFISMLIGDKTYYICRDINDFALHGNLPSQQSKRCKKVTIVTICVFTLVYISVYLSLSFYWKFNTKHDNLSQLQKFDFVNRWIQTILFTLVTIFYLFAALLIRNLQKNVHAKEKPLVKSHRVLWLLFANYLFIVLGLVYLIYAQGQYNLQLFLGQILSKIGFTVMKTQLFVVLSIFQLDITLRTQVLDSGQVAILGIDQFGREALRFLIQPEKGEEF